MSPYP